MDWIDSAASGGGAGWGRAISPSIRFSAVGMGCYALLIAIRFVARLMTDRDTCSMRAGLR